MSTSGATCWGLAGGLGPLTSRFQPRLSAVSGEDSPNRQAGNCARSGELGPRARGIDHDDPSRRKRPRAERWRPKALICASLTPNFRGDMKTNFDEYLRYEDLTRTLHDLAEEHPSLCRVESVGKSVEGREIWLVELTNARTGPADEKPAFWVDGNTHAGEVTGSMAALYLIEHLLQNHGPDNLVNRLLDEQAFYVLPRLSPDGAERYLTSPHTLRSNPRPWPEPEPEPGLQPEDLDGDGHVLQMRVEDEHGEWRVSEGDARLMVPRAPDEAGPGVTYYRLYKEGVFKDYDGFRRKIARPFHGLDMNRQYPYRWREDDDKEMPAHDLAVYKAIGERGTEITGYPNISVYHDFRYEEDKFITGAFDDWAFDYYGVFAFTIEFWSLAKAAGVEVKNFIQFFRDPPEEASLKMLAWNDRELGGEGFSPWTPFDHPQLGRVEVGGWKTKFTHQNPPPKFLEGECEKLARFALAHASTAPRLEADLLAEDLGPGVRRLELRVQNTGYLSTNVTRVAADKKLVKPVRAVLSLPERTELVSGEPEVDLGHLAGRPAP